MPVIQVAALEDVSLTKIRYAFLVRPNQQHAQLFLFS